MDCHNVQAPEPDVQQPETSATGAPKQRGWKHYLKMGACCGAPILALVILTGGGGAVLGAAGTLLPFLALLACPLGMYFMMRGMSKSATGEHESQMSKMRSQENPKAKNENQ